MNQQIAIIRKMVLELRSHFEVTDEMGKKQKLKYAGFYLAYDTVIKIIDATVDEFESISENK